MAALPDIGAEVVDLCICMDCTGSMKRLMEGARANIDTTIANIRAKYPGATVNLGFVAYRDHCDGDLRIEKFEFSPNVEGFQRFIADLEATGGGDYPEDVNGGLWESAMMDWSAPTRVLIHLFDAPPHGRNIYHNVHGDEFPDGHDDDKPMSEIFGQFKEADLNYYMMVQGEFALEQMTSKFQEEARRIDYDRLKIAEKNIEDVGRVMAVVSDAVIESLTLRPSTIPHFPSGDEAVERIHAPVFARRANEYKVYCAIDFGTTGSMVAFCTPDDPEVRRPSSWGGMTSENIKTPTHVLLDEDKNVVSFGKAALVEWLDMEPEVQARYFLFREFKMALYRRPDEARVGEVKIRDKIADVSGKELNASIVLRESLRYIIHNVAMPELQTPRYGVTSLTEVQWIITVPAIWCQKSQRIMEKAAYQAGIPRGRFDQVIIALEPECAAVDAIDLLELKTGDCYLMADVGGGTADMACFEMINNTEVKQIVAPSGGPWGAVGIDKAFLEYIKFLFGEEVWVIIDADSNLREVLMANFRQAKCCMQSGDEKRNVDIKILKEVLADVFGGLRQATERIQGLRFPEGADDCGSTLKARKGMLVVSRRIWDYLFETVIGELIQHIRELLDSVTDPDSGARRIQTLCVVGGFALSPLLMDRLQAEFGGECRVARTHYPDFSVVRGAAKFGLVPTAIAERVAKRTIGIAIRDDYRSGDDELPNFRGKQETRDGVMVEGVFFVFIRKGQPIERTMPPVVHHFQPNDRHRAQFVCQVYQSKELNPRFVPDIPCGTIRCTFPDDFDHNRYDIAVAFDFSQPHFQVTVSFGTCEPQHCNIDWDEEV